MQVSKCFINVGMLFFLKCEGFLLLDFVFLLASVKLIFTFWSLSPSLYLKKIQLIISFFYNLALFELLLYVVIGYLVELEYCKIIFFNLILWCYRWCSLLLAFFFVAFNLSTVSFFARIPLALGDANGLCLFARLTSLFSSAAMHIWNI